jgi:hypothetical protein
MADNIYTMITPALHPDNVKEIDGYGDDTAMVLGPTVTAFSEAYEGIHAVHVAREKAKTNPTWNEAQQIIHTDDLAQRHLARITKGFDSVRGNLERGIASIEQELSQPVTSRAGQGLASEIRAHVRGLPTAKLHDFLQRAMDGGDHDTVTAVLGAPAYLSGLTPEFQKTYLRFYHEQTSPDKAKRLKAMIGARTMIEERAGLVFKELEKAVGFITCPKTQRKLYPGELRRARDAAEAPFKVA